MHFFHSVRLSHWRISQTDVCSMLRKIRYLFICPFLRGFFYSIFTHKKCPIMFIMLHSSSITLYYHYFRYCSRLKILLFFILFISFHSIILILFTLIQQIEHFVAFKINRTLKTTSLLKSSVFTER